MEKIDNKETAIQPKGEKHPVMTWIVVFVVLLAAVWFMMSKYQKDGQEAAPGPTTEESAPAVE